ncbi:MAG: ATP synthase subunit C [Treponema sp.]|jgi:V/A-type H+-transporting ATPase subunit K|nr:ATP synthase subunit C [Treponema sp.]
MNQKMAFAALLFLALEAAVFAQEPEAQAESSAGAQAELSAETPAAAQSTSVWKYFAAALAVGISCIAGGIAVGQIGSAAMGAMSENPELSGKALPYAGLAEGICLWGFLVALLIMIL